MIINKINKEFQTRSDMPNSNWLNDDNYYVIPDNSPLANKIMQYFPRYDFVLDEHDNILDIIQISKTEQELIQQEIESIDLELSNIDSKGVTRHMENIIDASNSYDALYESTKQLIERKRALRVERATLVAKLETN